MSKTFLNSVFLAGTAFALAGCFTASPLIDDGGSTDSGSGNDSGSIADAGGSSDSGFAADSGSGPDAGKARDGGIIIFDGGGSTCATACDCPPGTPCFNGRCAITNIQGFCCDSTPCPP